MLSEAKHLYDEIEILVVLAHGASVAQRLFLKGFFTTEITRVPQRSLGKL